MNSRTAGVRAAAGAVVLGMGRSGTSAVTRCLVRSGFFAGTDSELMEATRANPVGHYENLAVFRANEEILHCIGATWFMPPSTKAQLDAASWAVPLLRGVAERLIDQAGDAPVVVKDPRIGVLLELWGPIIAQALHPVLVVRNPIEVAHSLATRDGTPVAFGLASWELHTAGVLEFLRGRWVTVVRYPQLVRSSEAAEKFVSSVVLELRADLAAEVETAAAGRAIEPSLHRERVDEVHAAEYLTGRQAELWELLDALPPGSQVLDIPSEITAKTPAAKLLSRCEVDRLRAEHELAGLRGKVAEYESALAENERARAEAERALAAERARAGSAEHVLRDLQSSASWRLTAPLRVGMQLIRRGRAGLRANR